MAKPVIKKSVTAAPKAVVAEAPKTRNRQTVLIKVTASKLHDLIGDQEIGVSRKELTKLITAGATAATLAAAGL